MFVECDCVCVSEYERNVEYVWCASVCVCEI